MPAFPKPTSKFSYKVGEETSNLRRWKKKRGIPKQNPRTLLVATWNIANLGAQARRNSDHRLIAEIISWFDLVAIQEVKDDSSGLKGILKHLKKEYKTVFTDPAGNNERLAYIYDAKKLRTRELLGELALDPRDLKNVKLPGIKQKFQGFDRNPFLQSFERRKFSFTLVNVHIYYGASSGAKLRRRQLETFALARWARRRARSRHVYDPDIILLGDFNLPVMQKGDPIYSILIKQGLQPTDHSTEIGTTLPSEKKTRTKRVYHYDQIAFFPHTGPRYTKDTGVFDYDGGVFPKLWKNRTQKEFNAYLRYYISDHRPLWAKFKC